MRQKPQYDSDDSSKFILDRRAILLLFFGLFVSSFVMQSVINVFLHFGINLLQNGWFHLIMNIMALAFPIWTFYLFGLKPQNKIFNFKYSSPKPKLYIIVVLMTLGVIFIVEFFTALIPTEGAILGEWHRYFNKQLESFLGNFWLMFFMMGVFAPILEEILFRGVLVQGLINKGLSPKKSILWISLIFGLIHGNPWQFVGAFLFGILLGWVYYKTNSLLPSLFLHSFNNLLFVFLLHFEGSESLSEYLGIAPLYSLLIGLGLVLLPYFFIKKFFKKIY